MAVRSRKDTTASRRKLKIDLLRHIRTALDARDQTLVDLASQLILGRYDEQRRRLIACGWGTKQVEPYWSFQLNTSRARECSVCAEAGVLMKTQDNDDEINTIVTVHCPDKRSEVPYVVPPCALCITRLDRFAEHAMIIVQFEGCLVKIPQDSLMSFPYPKD